MSSSSIRRGAVKTVEWWKHLRSRKRAQNKLVRQDGKERMKDDLKETREWAQELYEIAKAKSACMKAADTASGELKKRKAENTKLNKEAQLLMAKYRKEIEEAFKGMRK